MKYGITVSTYQTDFGPIVFKDGNLDQNIRDMRGLGYTGVDLFVNRRTDDQLLELKRKFEGEGIEIVTYLAIFLAEMGVKLSEIDGAKRRRDIDFFREQIDKARLMGAGSIALGFIRGGIGEGDTYTDCEKRLADSLHILGAYADKNGIVIGLEPINRYEINFLNTAAETMRFISRYDLSGVGILLDTFHMNIEDLSFRESILQAQGRITNVHAPGSSRAATGSGHLDYDEILGALTEIGYDGYLTVEAFAQPDAYTCAKQSVEFLKTKQQIINKESASRS